MLWPGQQGNRGSIPTKGQGILPFCTAFRLATYFLVTPVEFPPSTALCYVATTHLTTTNFCTGYFHVLTHFSPLTHLSLSLFTSWARFFNLSLSLLAITVEHASVRAHAHTNARTYLLKTTMHSDKDKKTPSQTKEFKRAPHTNWWLQYKPCFYYTLFFPDSEWLQLFGQKNVTWSWSQMWACTLHIIIEGHHGF